jgi:hypothetical protein
MSRRFRQYYLALLPAAFLATATPWIVGCGSGTNNAERPPISIDELESDGHVDHKHAETYPEAVEELAELNEAIATAFSANDSDAAHDPLHEVGHVLDEMTDLAKKQALSDEAVAEIGAAVVKLFDAFGKVDSLFHDGKGATYDEVKADIDSGMEVLRKHLPGTDQGQPTTPE